MAVIECGIHGLQYWFFGISKDIGHNISNDIPMKQEEIICISAINTTGFLTKTKYFLSNQFFKNLLFSRTILNGEQEAVDFFNRVEKEVAGVCTRCFEDYCKRYNLDLPLNFIHLKIDK